MSDDEVAACRQVFEVVDEDGSGSIGAAELQRLLKLLRLPTTQTEVLLMIAEVDKDGNGEVDFEEFLQANGPPTISVGRKCTQNSQMPLLTGYNSLP